MSLDINAVMNMLEESSGESISEVYIPSLEKEVGFKPLTVGMQKSISKMSLDFEMDIDYQFLKMSILQTLCVDDKIDFKTLTEVDFIAMLAQLRVNNFTEPVKLIVNCNKCSKKFNMEVNMEQIIESCKKFENKSLEVEKKTTIKDKEMIFKFELAESTIISNLEYMKYLEVINKDDNKVVDINNSRVLAYPLKFIKNVYINNQQVVKKEGEDTLIFNQLPMAEKIDFIDNLPPKLYSEKDDGVLQTTLNEFPHQRLLNLFPKVKCPYCKKKMEGVLTNDSFFII